MADPIEEPPATREIGRKQKEEWNRVYSLPDPLWKGPPTPGPVVRPGSLILEMGCGNGKTLSSLPLCECEVVAVDYAVAAVKWCRGRWGDHPGVQFAEADARYLPFVDSCYNLIVISHLLDHLLEGEREAAAQEAIRVIAPGGSIFIRVFSRSDLRCGKGDEIEEGTFRRSRIITHYFESKEIESLFQGLRFLSLNVRRTEKRYGGGLMCREEIEVLCQKPK
jgi:ubiquinone/menaquinone biosynthesis C-methylase UbiE